MNRMWPSMYLDTEKVIQEVSLRVLLWDPSHTLYTNRDARQASWRSVCREVVPDFDEASEEVQKKTELVIQKRWRTVRDCYAKNKAQNALIKGTALAKTYAYANILTFLDSTLQYAPASAIHPPDEPGSDEGATAAAATAPAARKRRKPPTKQPISPAIHKTNENMSTFENQLLECLRGEFDALEADDRDFFKSLGPVLKTFSNTQKLSFRSKVLAIVTDMNGEGEGDDGEGSSSSRSAAARRERTGHTMNMSLEEFDDNPSSPENKFIPQKLPTDE